MAERRRRRSQLSVHACAGETASARLAQDVAERVRALAADGSLGARVVAIDGCGSGCASRKLGGRRVAAESISLEELGVVLADAPGEADPDALAHAVVARLRARRATDAAARRRHDAPTPSAASATAVHTVEDYLFALSLLTSPVGACGAVASDVPTPAAHVARALGVSRPSAGEMLARMEDAGLVARGPGKAVVLTRRGRSVADRVVARHRVVERFLADVLRYSAGEAHTLALGIRGAFPDDVVERLRDLVAPAETCPHGWPLEPGSGIERDGRLVAVSGLPTGTGTSVAALAEHDGHELALLCELGLAPGVELEVEGHGADAGVVLGVAGRSVRLEAAQAAAVLVRVPAAGR